jgi:hypothetical protein
MGVGVNSYLFALYGLGANTDGPALQSSSFPKASASCANLKGEMSDFR